MRKVAQGMQKKRVGVVGRRGNKSKRAAIQEKYVDQQLIEGKLKVEPGYRKAWKSILYVHAFWRIFYVSIYYYLVPFACVIMSTYGIFF
jgi:DNA polymerase III alpha subunit (gram-positive type)